MSMIAQNSQLYNTEQLSLRIYHTDNSIVENDRTLQIISGLFIQQYFKKTLAVKNWIAVLNLQFDSEYNKKDNEMHERHYWY